MPDSFKLAVNNKLQALRKDISLSEKMEYLQLNLKSPRTFKAIESLSVNPDFQKKVINFLYDVIKEGYNIEITSALRTKEEQAKIVKKWNSQTLDSMHLSWQAIDIIEKGKPDIFKISLSVRQLAAKHGLWNGAEMWEWFDYPHFQDSLSFGDEITNPDQIAFRIQSMKNNGTLPTDYGHLFVHNLNPDIAAIVKKTIDNTQPIVLSGNKEDVPKFKKPTNIARNKTESSLWGV